MTFTHQDGKLNIQQNLCRTGPDKPDEIWQSFIFLEKAICILANGGLLSFFWRGPRFLHTAEIAKRVQLSLTRAIRILHIMIPHIIWNGFIASFPKRTICHGPGLYICSARFLPILQLLKLTSSVCFFTSFANSIFASFAKTRRKNKFIRQKN